MTLNTLTMNAEQFKEFLQKNFACEDSVPFTQGKSLAEFRESNYRPDWVFWIAENIGIPFIDTVPALCDVLDTIQHRMPDQRSRAVAPLLREMHKHGNIDRKDAEYMSKMASLAAFSSNAASAAAHAGGVFKVHSPGRSARMAVLTAWNAVDTIVEKDAILGAANQLWPLIEEKLNNVKTAE